MEMETWALEASSGRYSSMVASVDSGRGMVRVGSTKRVIELVVKTKLLDQALRVM